MSFQTCIHFAEHKRFDNVHTRKWNFVKILLFSQCCLEPSFQCSLTSFLFQVHCHLQTSDEQLLSVDVYSQHYKMYTSESEIHILCIFET